MGGRKGASELVGYVITFLIGAIVLVAIYALVVSVYNAQVSAEAYDELRQLGIQTSDSIIRLYNSGAAYSMDMPNNTAVLLGSVDLKYPPRVARRSYEILLAPPDQLYTILNISANLSDSGRQVSSGPKIVGRTLERPFVEVVISLPNLDAMLQGYVPNGVNPLLSFYKAKVNGTARNVISLGNASMLAYPAAGVTILVQ